MTDIRTQEKLDKILDQIGEIKVTLAGQAEIKRRTDVLEAAVLPLQRHAAMVQGALKFIGIVGAIVGILAGVAKAVGG